MDDWDMGSSVVSFHGIPFIVGCGGHGMAKLAAGTGTSSAYKTGHVWGAYLVWPCLGSIPCAQIAVLSLWSQSLGVTWPVFGVPPRPGCYSPRMQQTSLILLFCTPLPAAILAVKSMMWHHTHTRRLALLLRPVLEDRAFLSTISLVFTHFIVQCNSLLVPISVLVTFSNSSVSGQGYMSSQSTGLNTFALWPLFPDFHSWF